MSKARRIGQCIYCRTTEGRLDEEHIVPFGLNGDVSLLEASCQNCSRITSKFETKVLRDSLFAARAAAGAKTRRKKERDRERPMPILRDGKEEIINVHWRDHWKIMYFPVFKPPACLDRRPYAGGVEAERMEVAWFEESPEELARRHNAEDVLLKIHNVREWATAYARLIAKIGYGIAVNQFGLNGVEEAFVVPAILGETDDIGRWVGCDGRRLMTKSKYHLWASRLNVTAGYISARIKLFASSDGTEYIVVVGRARDSVQGVLQSAGYGGS